MMSFPQLVPKYNQMSAVGASQTPVILIVKVKDTFSGYFDRENTVLNDKINNFRGDVTDALDNTI